MTNIHPDENEIQNYILNASSNVEIVGHMLHCKSCSLKADQYRQLFEGIHHQESPAFEFNVTALILDQLLRHPRQVDAFRRLQGIGLGSRKRPAGSGVLSRDKGRVHDAELNKAN